MPIIDEPLNIIPACYTHWLVGATPTTLRLGLNAAVWRSPMQTKAPRSARPASPKNAPESLPVVCFRNPMMLGPKKPPLVPIELTNAIPTAAEDPLRSLVGTHQNEVMNIGLPT